MTPRLSHLELLLVFLFTTTANGGIRYRYFPANHGQPIYGSRPVQSLQPNATLTAQSTRGACYCGLYQGSCMVFVMGESLARAHVRSNSCTPDDCVQKFQSILAGACRGYWGMWTDAYRPTAARNAKTGSGSAVSVSSNGELCPKFTNNGRHPTPFYDLNLSHSPQNDADGLFAIDNEHMTKLRHRGETLLRGTGTDTYKIDLSEGDNKPLKFLFSKNGATTVFNLSDYLPSLRSKPTFQYFGLDLGPGWTVLGTQDPNGIQKPEALVFNVLASYPPAATGIPSIDAQRERNRIEQSGHFGNETFSSQLVVDLKPDGTSCVVGATMMRPNDGFLIRELRGAGYVIGRTQSSSITPAKARSFSHQVTLAAENYLLEVARRRDQLPCLSEEEVRRQMRSLPPGCPGPDRREVFPQ